MAHTRPMLKVKRGTAQGTMYRCPLVTSVLAVSLLGLSTCSRKDSGPEVTINNTTWDVELATTPEQRYRGLSGRSKIPKGTGMLFVFPAPQVLSFCMRGCTVALDIAFIGPDMRVAGIHTMRVEPDLAGRITYSSVRAVQFALEVPGGELESGGVKPGSKVTFSRQIQVAVKGLSSP